MYILKETMLCLIVNMALVQNRFKAFVTRFDIKSLSLCFDKAFVIGNQQRRRILPLQQITNKTTLHCYAMLSVGHRLCELTNTCLETFHPIKLPTNGHMVGIVGCLVGEWTVNELAEI